MSSTLTKPLNKDGIVKAFPWKRVLVGDIPSLDDGDLAQIMTLAHFVDKVIGGRLGSLKNELKSRMMGERITDSTTRYEHPVNGIVDVQEKEKHSIDEDILREILVAKDIPLDTVFIEVTNTELSESRLSRLVASGELTDKDLLKCSKVRVSRSVVVRKHAFGLDPKEFIKALEE